MNHTADYLRKLCVEQSKTVRDVVACIDSTRNGIAFIVDTANKLVGTITDGDIRRAVLANIEFSSPLKVVLDRKKGTKYEKPITGLLGSSQDTYLKILKKHKLMSLPIVDKLGVVQDLVNLEDFIKTPDYSVRAVIMAGGKGTRLMPLTKKTPKPMLHVGGKPLMETTIKQLSLSGIKDFHISTLHAGKKIERHFGDGKKLNVNVSYLAEDKPLGTAGALGLLEKSAELLLVINGDILTDLDYKKMFNYHVEHKADMTVAVRQYDVKVPFGVVKCEDHDVKGLTEKPEFNFFVNAGIYLIDPKVQKFLPKNGDRLDMTDFIENLIQLKKRVVSFPILEEWLDIGNHEDYKKAQEKMKGVVEKTNELEK